MSALLRFPGLLALWLPWMAALGLLYLTVPPSPDQSQFDWMAFIATQGQPYYAGSFDMNWPGAMWLHEFGLRLFGVQAWTWRATDFLLLAGFTGAGGVFLWRAGWPLAAAIFLMLYPPLYVTSGSWMAGQRDIVAAGFLLAAAALSLPGRGPGPRREGGAMALAGVCIAAAVLIRPTCLSFLAGLLALEALPLRTRYPRQVGRARRAGLLALGFAAAIGGVAAAMRALGILDDWYEQSVLFALSVYAGDPPQDWRLTLHTLFVRSWHWITALASLGVLLWAWRDGARRDGASHALVVALGIAATGAVSFAVQDKGFAYHLGAALTVMALLVAVALEGLAGLRAGARGPTGRAAATAVLALAGALVVAGTAQKLTSLAPGAALLARGDLGPQDGHGLTEQERRRIVSLIRAGSGPEDTVLVYGTRYELAFRAGRLPTHRFINLAVDEMDESFARHDAWLAEIDAALAARPPAFVILRRSVIEGPITAPRPAEPGAPVLARLTALIATGYTPVFETEGLAVLRAPP